jgi:hypothetical protein
MLEREAGLKIRPTTVAVDAAAVTASESSATCQKMAAKHGGMG